MPTENKAELAHRWLRTNGATATGPPAMITVAIVPILVPAGATAFAAISAALSSLLASLRPIEWLRVFSRQSARVACLCLAGLTIAAISGVLAFGHFIHLRSRPRTDWAQVALNQIRIEQLERDRQSPATKAPQQLKLLWEFKQPGASFLSTPALANNRVYSASCLVDVGGTFGSIFALDSKTGQPIWQIDKIGGEDLKGIFSSPALTADGKYLIIGEGLHFDSNTHLICLEAASGKLHWKIDIPRNHVESSPAIFNDVVVVGAGAIERHDHLPVDSTGYALCVRIADGKVLWRSDVVDPESSPAIAPDGTSYIGSGVNGSAVVALSATGTSLWKTSTAYPALGPISLRDNLIVAGTGRGDLVNADPHPAGAVVALDRANGTIRWQTVLPDAVIGEIAIDDEKAICPARDGTVVALDLETGKRIWTQRISEAPVLSGAVCLNGNVYAVSSDGFLKVLDLKTGHLLEKHALNDEANPGRSNLSLSTPRVSRDRVYVGSETGGLRCFAGTPGP